MFEVNSPAICCGAVFWSMEPPSYFRQLLGAKSFNFDNKIEGNEHVN